MSQEIARQIAQAYGITIKSRRQAQGLSMRGLAQLSGVAASRISQIERGIGFVSLTTMVSLASALDIKTLEDGFGETRVVLPTERWLSRPPNESG